MWTQIGLLQEQSDFGLQYLLNRLQTTFVVIGALRIDPVIITRGNHVYALYYRNKGKKYRILITQSSCLSHN